MNASETPITFREQLRRKKGTQSEKPGKLTKPVVKRKNAVKMNAVKKLVERME